MEKNVNQLLVSCTKAEKGIIYEIVKAMLECTAFIDSIIMANGMFYDDIVNKLEHLDEIRKKGIDNVKLYKELTPQDSFTLRNKALLAGEMLIEKDMLAEYLVLSSSDLLKSIVADVTGLDMHDMLRDALYDISDNMTTAEERAEAEETIKYIQKIVGINAGNHITTVK